MKKKEEVFVYDVYYNDINELVVISDSKEKEVKIMYEGIEMNSILSEPNEDIFIHKKSAEFKEEIKININERELLFNPKKYPNLEGRTIVSTLVRNEDPVIVQWIEFNKLIGVENFIIYDNSNVKRWNENFKAAACEKSNLPELLKEYIKRGEVILIDWPFPYKKPNHGFVAQKAQQNHSLHAFRKSKYIGFIDVDEYINLQGKNNLEELFESQDVNQEIGGFRFKNRSFYNADHQPEDGYEFLKIQHCSGIQNRFKCKCFVIPKKVEKMAVHIVRKGVKEYLIDDAYFNHYEFLNKKSRGHKHKKKHGVFLDNSMLVYYEKISQKQQSV
jgi:hypothetical protein